MFVASCFAPELIGRETGGSGSTECGWNAVSSWGWRRPSTVSRVRCPPPALRIGHGRRVPGPLPHSMGPAGRLPEPRLRRGKAIAIARVTGTSGNI